MNPEPCLPSAATSYYTIWFEESILSKYFGISLTLQSSLPSAAASSLWYCSRIVPRASWSSLSDPPVVSSRPPSAETWPCGRACAPSGPCIASVESLQRRGTAVGSGAPFAAIRYNTIRYNIRYNTIRFISFVELTSDLELLLLQYDTIQYDTLYQHRGTGVQYMRLEHRVKSRKMCIFGTCPE